MRLPFGLSALNGSLLRADLLAGVTLAAVAVPESMATARLGNFAPGYGLLAFVLASVGFALTGRSPTLSAGPDSTITPIFAGALAALGSAGAGLAPTLALGVGLLLGLCGLARLGWLANLLSRPVLTGFLAGIAAHIVLSQAPTLLGRALDGGSAGARLLLLAQALPHLQPAPLALGLTVLLIAALGERYAPRAPWLLIGVAVSTLLASAFGPRPAVALVGTIARTTPHLVLPRLAPGTLGPLLSLTCVVAAIVLMQTCVVSRSFQSPAERSRGESRDLLGIGAANLLAGLFGTFPVNASPPRTAIVTEAGGRSRLAALVAAGIVVLVLVGASGLLARVPQAALAGVLVHVAIRLVRMPTLLDVARRNRVEFVLLTVTACAVLFLPIQVGVAIGIALSLAHGLWSVSRAEVVGFEPVPGTTIWWPRHGPQSRTDPPDVHVIGFQAPLSFLNAEAFVAGVRAELARRAQAPRLLVIEASSLASVDYSGAIALGDLIRECRSRGIDVGLARLESVRAQEQFERYGLLTLLGAEHVQHSVAQTIERLLSSPTPRAGAPDRK